MVRKQRLYCSTWCKETSMWRFPNCRPLSATQVQQPRSRQQSRVFNECCAALVFMQITKKFCHVYFLYLLTRYINDDGKT